MHWQLSFLIGLPIGLSFTIAGLCVALWCFRKWQKGAGYFNPDWGFFSICGAIVTLLAGGLTALSLVPYDAEYWQWRPVDGVVQSVDSRLLKDGEGMSERYVLTINGTPYGVDDTRAATVAAGDKVRLMCTKEWQWAADDGYACRWGK